MLPGLKPMMIGGAASLLTMSFITNVPGNSDATSYNFTGTDIGTASADRYIVVCVYARRSGAAVNSSCTVAGQAMTKVVGGTISTTDNLCAIWISDAPVTSGTTAAIVVGFNATMLRCSIGVYTITGGTPVLADTASDSGGADPNVSIDVPVGGVVVATAGNANNVTTTWTGVTEDFTDLIESSNTHTCAHENLPAGETGRSVQITFGGGDAGDRLNVASWGLS